MLPLQTGDLLFFSSNTPTAFLLKTFTSSQWCHVGVAIRMSEGSTAQSGYCITDEKIYVLETNSVPRLDADGISQIAGVALSDMKQLEKRYNHIGIRHLNLTEAQRVLLEERTSLFIDTFYGVPFPDSPIPFLSAWTGIGLSRLNSTYSPICSEITVQYLQHCLNLDLPLFENGPSQAKLYTPGLLSSGQCSIMNENTEDLYIKHCDVSRALFTPVVLILFSCVILKMVLDAS